MNSLFFGISSRWGIGGIHLTEFLLSYSLLAILVYYKKPVCIVVFCREAVMRCGITLSTP